MTIQFDNGTVLQRLIDVPAFAPPIRRPYRYYPLAPTADSRRLTTAGRAGAAAARFSRGGANALSDQRRSAILRALAPARACAGHLQRGLLTPSRLMRASHGRRKRRIASPGRRSSARMSKSATAGSRERRNFFCAASARSERSENSRSFLTTAVLTGLNTGIPVNSRIFLSKNLHAGPIAKISRGPAEH
jgi:hypothetical protein